MSKDNDKKLGHWIIPGDWIIREAPEPTFENEYSDVINPTGFALSDRAVKVLCATKTHLTIFDPIRGRSGIIQLSLFPGVWRKATKMQVEATWDRALDHTKTPEDMRLLQENRKKHGP